LILGFGIKFGISYAIVSGITYPVGFKIAHLIPNPMRFGISYAFGFGIRYHGDFQVLPEAKAIPLQQKRKRGRPAKAKKALIVQ